MAAEFYSSRIDIVTTIQDGCPKNPGSIPDRGKNFSRYQCAQNGPVFHTACFSVGNCKIILQGLKRPGREDDHSNPFAGEVKSE